MEPTIDRYAATVTDLDTKRRAISVRVMPYGETIDHRGEQIQYDRGSLKLTDGRVAQVMTSHDGDALDVIGRVESFTETDDGAYARLRIADTTPGREMLELLEIGAIDEVSAGVAIDPEGETTDRDGTIHRAGNLDHVVITRRGAFGTAGDGSRVLAVHTQEKRIMPDTDPQTYDDTELRTQLEELTEQGEELTEQGEELAEENRTLRAQIEELGEAEDETPAEHYADVPLGAITDAMVRTQGGDSSARDRLAAYALEDDTTTTAAGIVPDYYSSEVLAIVDTARPWWSALSSDPIGDVGMNVVYPRVTAGPSVAVQAAQKTEVDSTVTAIEPYSVALKTFAGASDVAIQLIERSSPAFMAELFRLYAGKYAQATETDLALAVLIAANAQDAVADLSTDAAATVAALTSAAKAVLVGVRRMPDLLLVGVDRWEQLAKLSDTDGRPLFPLGDDNPRNAIGESSLASTAGTVRGLRLVVSPDAVATECVIAWSGAVATLEQAPVQLRAVQVGVLGYDVGIYGYAGFAMTYPAGLQSIPII